MAWFKPKTPRITPAQMAAAEQGIKQVNESAKFVNTTLKVDVFFKRLHFLLDCLLELQEYEIYDIFKNNPPSTDYRNIVADLGKTVNAFIDRSIKTELEAISKLKTEKSQKTRLEKYHETMINAFNNSNSFWDGNYTSFGKLPHYNDKLCSPGNIAYFETQYEKIKYQLDI